MTSTLLGEESAGVSGEYQQYEEHAVAPVASSVVTAAPTIKRNLVDLLSDLAALRSSGALTEQEFLEAKSQLLR